MTVWNLTGNSCHESSKGLAENLIEVLYTETCDILLQSFRCSGKVINISDGRQTIRNRNHFAKL